MPTELHPTWVWFGMSSRRPGLGSRDKHCSFLPTPISELYISLQLLWDLNPCALSHSPQVVPAADPCAHPAQHPCECAALLLELLGGPSHGAVAAPHPSCPSARGEKNPLSLNQILFLKIIQIMNNNLLTQRALMLRILIQRLRRAQT